MKIFDYAESEYSI